MKVRYMEEMASHSNPESCATHREVWSEASAGKAGRPAIELRNDENGMLIQCPTCAEKDALCAEAAGKS